MKKLPKNLFSSDEKKEMKRIESTHSKIMKLIGKPNPSLENKEVVCADGHTYIRDVPVEFGTDRVKNKDGSIMIVSKIKRINVTDYENLYFIDGELYRRIK